MHHLADLMAGVTERVSSPGQGGIGGGQRRAVLALDRLGRLLPAPPHHPEIEGSAPALCAAHNPRGARRPPPSPPSHSVLTGHISSLSSYLLDTSRPSPRTYWTRLVPPLAGCMREMAARARGAPRPTPAVVQTWQARGVSGGAARLALLLSGNDRDQVMAPTRPPSPPPRARGNEVQCSRGGTCVSRLAFPSPSSCLSCGSPGGGHPIYKMYPIYKIWEHPIYKMYPIYKIWEHPICKIYPIYKI
jgi:hypothetical protein